MPNVKKIAGKNGFSYKITVSLGRDQAGKQLRHFKTYTPPPEMKEARADKEAARIALQFEEELRQGYQPDNRMTFQEYADYFMNLKQKTGLKRSTYERYLLLLRRINAGIGHMKLSNIHPHHLNKLYENLMEDDIRLQSSLAYAKGNLTETLQQKGISQAGLSSIAGLAASTIRKARSGEAIQLDKAQAISAALELPIDKLFRIQGNTKPLATKTVLEHHRLIRTILGQAEKELMVPYNAASKATPPKVHRTSVNSFEPAEISAILQALESEPIKWRTIIHLLIVTGCRRGEIMGLKWKNVNLDHGILLICETLLASDSGVYTDTPKTSESQRAINIPPETVALLKAYRKEQDQIRLVVGDRWQDTDYIFTRENGLPMHPDSVNGWLKQFSERHGLPHINPHAFRHSMASILINSGTDILSISKRLGHSMTSTTLNIYGHVLNQADARSSECIADTLLRNKLL